MPCFSTIQWLASDTNGLSTDAAMSAWLYGPEDVADVVEQGAHDVLVVLAAAVGARRRLQRVLEAIDGEAAGVTLEHPQVGEHAVGETGGELQVVAGDDAPVERRALRHRVERRRGRRPGSSSVTPE